MPGVPSLSRGKKPRASLQVTRGPLSRMEGAPVRTCTDGHYSVRTGTAQAGLKCPGHGLVGLLVSGVSNIKCIGTIRCDLGTLFAVPSFRPLFLPAEGALRLPSMPSPVQPSPSRPPLYLLFNIYTRSLTTPLISQETRFPPALPVGIDAHQGHGS